MEGELSPSSDSNEQTVECSEASNYLKQPIANHPIITFPDINEAFLLNTDVSDITDGALLPQVSKWHWKSSCIYQSCLKITK